MVLIRILTKILILLFLFENTISYSQNSVFIHAGYSIPLYDFKSVNIDGINKRNSEFGFNLGLNYIYSFSNNRFGIFGSSDISFNNLSQKLVFKDARITSERLTNFKYLNMPLSAGFNYKSKDYKYILFFSNLGITLNSLKIENMIINYNNIDFETVFFVVHSIGYRIGAGILLDKTIAISVDYFDLGNHRIKGTSGANNIYAEITGNQKVDILIITMGIKINNKK